MLARSPFSTTEVRHFHILTTYLETGMAEGLGLRLPSPFCPAIHVGGGAVAISSTSPGAGVVGGTMVGATMGPGTTA
jgi:hypothetical protein